MASGVAMTTSKSMLPFLTSSARSSIPTMSAPASLALSAFAPWVKTATRTVLPVPWGRTVLLRTTWSDFRASTPRLTATSMDSRNLTELPSSVRRATASSTLYARVESTFSRISFWRLVSLLMSEALHIQTHATGGTRDGANGSFQVSSRQIRLLGLGDLFKLSASNGTHLFSVRTARATLDASRLFQQHRRRRSLCNESETTVAIYSNNNWRRQPGFDVLCGCVKRLTELHNVNAVLTQCRTNRGTRVGLTGSNLKLDVRFNLLCHEFLLWVVAPFGSPVMRREKPASPW